MAEALAVVGSVAAIIQLIDITCKTIWRIQDHAGHATAIPLKLRHTIICLPVLLDYLSQLRNQPTPNTGHMQQVLVGFHDAISALERDILRVMPLRTDSRTRRMMKVVRSMRADQQIRMAEMVIEQYKTTLILCLPPRNTDTHYIGTKKRDMFFYYILTDIREVGNQIRQTKEYQQIVSSLVLRRGEVKGTSVVNVPAPRVWPGTWLYFTETICRDFRASGLAEVIIHLEPFCASWEDKPLRISGPQWKYLGLDKPSNSGWQSYWDTLRAVLEHWQRKWLLVIDFSTYYTRQEDTHKMANMTRYMLDSLPSSRDGQVVILSPEHPAHEKVFYVQGSLVVEPPVWEFRKKGFSVNALWVLSEIDRNRFMLEVKIASSRAKA